MPPCSGSDVVCVRSHSASAVSAMKPTGSVSASTTSNNGSQAVPEVGSHEFSCWQVGCLQPTQSAFRQHSAAGEALLMLDAGRLTLATAASRQFPHKLRTAAVMAAAVMPVAAVAIESAALSAAAAAACLASGATVVAQQESQQRRHRHYSSLEQHFNYQLYFAIIRLQVHEALLIVC